jgi:hypothetical protein
VFTIVNNDVGPPPVTYSLSPNPASVNENAGTLTLTVTRSSSSSAGTVYVSTVADQGFANNGNYTNLNAQAVSFGVGQLTANVSISIADLGLTSGSENYRAVVLPTAASPTSAAVASDVFTIVNNDVGSPPTQPYSLSPNPATVSETGKTLTLTLTRANTSSFEVLFVNTLTDQGFVNKGNFTALGNQLIFLSPGQSTATISIAINNVGLTSGSETYRVIVTPTASGAPSTAVASDVFTIVNGSGALAASPSSSLPDFSSFASNAKQNHASLLAGGLSSSVGVGGSLLGSKNELLNRMPTHFAAGT